MKAWLRRLLARLGPVCQNKTAILYGQEGGMSVPLRPVIDSDGVVTEWIPDPNVMEMAASAAAEAATPSPMEPPVLPGDTASTIADGLNPAGVSGL